MSRPNLVQPQFDQLPNVFDAAAEHGRELMVASLKTWVAEGRAYFDDLAKDGAEALHELGRCKSPLDLIMVEQHWLMARSKSWFDACLRLCAGAVHEAESAAAEAGGFRLPE